MAKAAKKTTKKTPTKRASTTAKKSTSKKKATPKTATATIDRRREDRRKESQPAEAERRKIERRAKTPRRRQIDPTTCERDYSNDEIEFMNALDEYKRKNGRMFPTCSEVLEVIRGLGYRKHTEPAVVNTEADAPSAPPIEMEVSADAPLTNQFS
ncbi:MAG: hypothetical protein MPJ50_01035 [Pirellulales bacterium]|nr:hypothetical protein [Pirellulales bacterium]